MHLVPINAGGGGGGGGGGATPSLTTWSDPLTACLSKVCSFVAGFLTSTLDKNHIQRWHWWFVFIIKYNFIISDCAVDDFLPEFPACNVVWLSTAPVVCKIEIKWSKNMICNVL